MPGRPTQADLPLRPSDVTDFATLYGENCAGCHGADGKFGAAIAMNNPVYLAIVDDASMRRVIADGVAGTAMPPFAQNAGGSLTDRQIDILIAGIRKSLGGCSGCWRGRSALLRRHGRFVSRRPGLCVKLPVVSRPRRQGWLRVGSIVDASYLSLVSDQYLRTSRDRGTPRPRPSRLEERRRRTTVDARTSVRRGRMAGLETSRTSWH